MKSFAVLGLALVASLPAYANDTTVQLTTGGLEFVVNNDIEMLSEDLFISTQEIRVVYEFRNNGKTDQNVLVGFPMPDITPNWWSDSAFPDGSSENLFDFKTTFDGAPVDATLHAYAYAAGVDRSDYLRGIGLSLLSFEDSTRAATDQLDPAIQAEMLHLGLIVPEGYDAEDGADHYWPNWTYRATYTWEANFPAGKTVKVEHRYKPSVGGTVAVSLLGEVTDEYDPSAAYVKYCPDEAFKNAIRKTLVDKDEPWSAPFYEQWISYILTTGGNWSGGAIAKFKLTVDKGEERNLISFCGDNVKKVGPTTFEMNATDFYPEKEIDILILQRHDD